MLLILRSDASNSSWPSPPPRLKSLMRWKPCAVKLRNARRKQKGRFRRSKRRRTRRSKSNLRSSSSRRMRSLKLKRLRLRWRMNSRPQRLPYLRMKALQPTRASVSKLLSFVKRLRRLKRLKLGSNRRRRSSDFCSKRRRPPPQIVKVNSSFSSSASRTKQRALNQ